MRQGLWTKSKRNEADAVGCLIILGALVLFPAFIYGWGSFLVFLQKLVPASRSIAWSDIPIIKRELLQWLLGRSEGGGTPRLVALFAAGLVFLLWQWVAVLVNWRPRLPAKRIWMISSWYFVAAIIAFAAATWDTGDSRSTNSFGAWLMITLLFSVVPGAFLAVTLPLWLLRRRRHPPPTDSTETTTPS